MNGSPISYTKEAPSSAGSLRQSIVAHKIENESWVLIQPRTRLQFMSQFDENLSAILLTNTAASLPINLSTNRHKGVKSALLSTHACGTLPSSLSQLLTKYQMVHDSCMLGFSVHHSYIKQCLSLWNHTPRTEKSATKAVVLEEVHASRTIGSQVTCDHARAARSPKASRTSL